MTYDAAVLDTLVADLELSARAAHCLKNDNVLTVRDLVQKTEAEMLRTPNFGRVSLSEIKEVLAGMGLHLGMVLPEAPMVLESEVIPPPKFRVTIANAVQNGEYIVIAHGFDEAADVAIKTDNGYHQSPITRVSKVEVYSGVVVLPKV